MESAHLENTPESLNLLKSLKFKLDRRTLEILYKSLVRSVVDYAVLFGMAVLQMSAISLRAFKLKQQGLLLER